MTRTTIFVVIVLVSGAGIARGQTQSTEQQPPQKITISEIRVHGNATMADDEVIKLAGVSVGAILERNGLRAVEKRLRDSGRFDDVQVRERYRTLEMDDVALILLVHEKPGVRADGSMPSPLHRLTSRLMFLPILTYDDGYGWTYGGRVSTVDALGMGERLSVPLTWGATRRATLEAERTFASGPLTRVQGSFGISQRENPFYDLDDQRTELRGRVERRLFGLVTVGADAARTHIEFGGAPDHFWTGGGDVTLDTRRDPAFPSDAVRISTAWNRLNLTETGINRYRVDASGFKRVIRQAVFAVHAQYDTADAALPAYERWLVGGSNLRGTPAGTLAGDKRLLGAAELRVPFDSPLSTGRVGFTVFMDAARTSLFGESLSDAHTYRGAGAGVFLVVPFITLNLDVAHSLDGYGTRVHFSTGFSF
jgi:outer membrane protein assembly factor BamA